MELRVHLKNARFQSHVQPIAIVACQRPQANPISIELLLNMAMRSCDVLLDGAHKVHLSIVPKLSLILINELEDFAENWIQVDVIQNSTNRPLYDIRTLAGDTKQQEPCRYLIEAIRLDLLNFTGHAPSQISASFRFLVNIQIKPEIVNSRPTMNSLADALRMVLREFHNKAQTT